ncbi:M43 family zinc metalloprotease [Negadavirga shengliensis]|uniref:M43 family zinc metalloprotease n=1 Tax=Negadavirga shengliensis TaxID=1389218 RepID=A0ABV9T4A7_9BACT
MNEFWKALAPLWVSVLFFFIFLPLDIFSQTLFGRAFQHEHDEKCGAVYIEKKQQEQLGVYGTREFFEAWMEDRAEERKKKPEAFRTMDEGIRRIPVVVHVIHNGTPVGEGANIPEAQLLSQIRILNEDFQKRNADAVNTPEEFQGVAGDAQIEFVLAMQDPMGMPTNGINRVEGPKESYSLNDGPLIGELASWPPEEYMNIWVVPLTPPTIGYSSFPESDELPGLDFPPPTRQTDGVTIDYRYFGTGGNALANSRGRTTTHEVGHFLGLRHNWGDGGCGVDDYVDDTPDQDRPNNSCSATPRFSCDSRDMVENFMDYTPDQCMTLFTQGQVERIDVVLAFSPRRHSLLTSRALEAPQLFDNDLSVEAIISPNDFVCSPTAQPEIRVINQGTERVTHARVAIRLNGQLLENRNFDLDIPTGELATLTFGNVSIPTTGENVFEVEILEVNHGPDEDETDNRKQSFPRIAETAAIPYFYQGHQESEKWDFINPDSGMTWEPLSLTIGGESQDLFYMNAYNYNVQGELDYLVSPKLDLSQLNEAQLNFQLSFAPYANEEFQEALIVAVSTDCGNTFDVLQAPYNKRGVSLGTAEASFNEFFPNSEHDFRREVVDLDAYAGFSDVRIAFIAINGFGNNIFIKDIAINEEKIYNYDFEISSFASPLPVTNGDQENESLLITNTGNLAIEHFFLERSTNNSTPEVILFEDIGLGVGETREISLSSSLSEGLNRVSYRIYEPNFDQNPGSEDAIVRYFVQDTVTILSPWRQNFNASDAFTPWIRVNPESNNSKWRVIPLESQQENVAVLENPDSGDSYWLVSPEFDLSMTRSASLFFDWTGGGFDPERSSKMDILVSNDGGVSYTKVWEKEASALNVVGTGNMPNPNTAADYESAYANLSDYAGEGNEKVRVYIRLQNQNDRNAAVYLNNLELYLSENPDPVDPGLNNALIFPNPTDDLFNISFNLTDYEDVNIQFISTTGQVVYDVDYPNTLNQTYTFSKVILSKGLFIVKISSDSITVNKRLIVR